MDGWRFNVWAPPAEGRQATRTRAAWTILGVPLLGLCQLACQASAQDGTLELSAAPATALLSSATGLRFLARTTSTARRVVQRGELTQPPFAARLERLPLREALIVESCVVGQAGSELACGLVGPFALDSDQEALLILPIDAPGEFPRNASPLGGLLLAPARPGPGEAVFVRALGRPSSEGPETVEWRASAGLLESPGSTSTRWLLPQDRDALELSLSVRHGGLFTSNLGVTLAVGGRGSAAVTARLNTWPIASRLTVEPAALEPGGSASVQLVASDPDGDPLNVLWSDNCGGSFLGAGLAPSWAAPAQAPASGRCTLRAQIADGLGGQNEAAVTISVGQPPSANRAPEVASAYQSREVAASGESIVLRLAARDPEGGPVSVGWSASAGTLTAPTESAQGSEVTWQAPTGGCGHVVTATARDLAGAATSWRFSVRCPTCGDGSLQSGESCDGPLLGGQSCASQGFVVGRLGCGTTCGFDLSGCRALLGLSSPTTRALQGVGGSASTRWAVGQGGAIVRLTAAGAASVPSPVTTLLRAAFGSSAAEAWVVGDSGTLLRFGGWQWAVWPAPVPGSLRALSGTGPSDLWAAGDAGVVLRFDGGSWTRIPTSTAKALAGLWAGPTEVWAVGAEGTILRGGLTGFATARTGPKALRLTSIWGSAANDVWAVGTGGTVLRFDGGSWTSVASGTTADLHAVWGSGPNDVWMAGAAGTLLRFDGSTLSRVPSGTTQDLFGIFGGASGEALVVGGGGTLLSIVGGATP
ncbi:MAG: hypothetical protein IT371_12045 [Deltaproteobacteria bacterium]|nr:hypothetical protein [Deltaproteobacteria bacterium]